MLHCILYVFIVRWALVVLLRFVEKSTPRAILPVFPTCQFSPLNHSSVRGFTTFAKIWSR